MWRKPYLWIGAVAIAVIAVSTLPWTTPTAEADNTLRAPRAVVWKDYLGVNAQFQYFSPTIYKKQLQMLNGLGLTWVRLTIHWPIIEPNQNQFDLNALDGAMAAMQANNNKVLAYLVGSAPWATSAPSGAASTDQYPPKDYSVFADRMTRLAQRYSFVDTWQVWNEPNIIWQPAADPTAYGNLLFQTADAIRAKLPNQRIATAGMAYYSQMQGKEGLMLQTLLDMGLASKNIVAAYHPYTEYPEGDDPDQKDFIARSTFINNALHAKGVSQVWATEWGWSSYHGERELQAIIGVDGQADYTLRRLALMSAMDYQRIFLFNLNDLDARATPRDMYYGLIDLNGDPKPVYTALKNFLTVTGARLEPADAPAVSGGPSDLYNITWTRSDGTKLWMFWSATGTSLTLPSVTAAKLYDPLTGSQTTLTGKQGVGVSVPLKTSLQLLVWQ